MAGNTRFIVHGSSFKTNSKLRPLFVGLAGMPRC